MSEITDSKKIEKSKQYLKITMCETTDFEEKHKNPKNT